MTQTNKEILETLNFLNQKTDNFKPQIVIVLGSGLGVFSQGLDGIKIPYKNIPNFGSSNVQGHKGELLFTEIENKKCIVMQGRFHYYEGNSMLKCTFPIKVFSQMGAETVILTNAAGCANPDFKPGDIMLIKDHINFMGNNPLIGPNDDSLGTRFPDMTNIYTKSLQQLALNKAKELDIDLKEGIYLATSGPSYETPSEVQMYKSFGADVIGMSTAPEAIVSKYLNMQTLGFSMVTNFAAGIKKDTTLSHQEVIEEGKIAGAKLSKLIMSVLADI